MTKVAEKRENVEEFWGRFTESHWGFEARVIFRLCLLRALVFLAGGL
jgi:hypothetical protein